MFTPLAPDPQGLRDSWTCKFSLIENLYIWKESRVFLNAIYCMMITCKDYGFRDQIQRAAVSIMNNTAEGSESGYDAKFINLLN